MQRKFWLENNTPLFDPRECFGTRIDTKRTIDSV